ncbi:hypothetical protein Taro_041963 [Colocasia esculenta]|uniref:Uncharacterized protein n=1 Tax=Colocasia esculenta TaxID=4460 RepID=A0A843X1K5_COLES|nr:hypothetical protein [Colocasia esculenta]
MAIARSIAIAQRGLQSALFLRHIRAPLMIFQQRALGDAVLATSAAQTCADFPPAFISSIVEIDRTRV